jgi:hypothetical protein
MEMLQNGGYPVDRDGGGRNTSRYTDQQVRGGKHETKQGRGKKAKEGRSLSEYILIDIMLHQDHPFTRCIISL